MNNTSKIIINGIDFEIKYSTRKRWAQHQYFVGIDSLINIEMYNNAMGIRSYESFKTVNSQNLLNNILINGVSLLDLILLAISMGVEKIVTNENVEIDFMNYEKDYSEQDTKWVVSIHQLKGEPTWID